jgi:hypothetical protein
LQKVHIGNLTDHFLRSGAGLLGSLPYSLCKPTTPISETGRRKEKEEFLQLQAFDRAFNSQFRAAV